MRHRGGSFRLRVFLALVAMSLLPTILVLVTGTVAVRQVMSGAGTAGPWGEVAESGRVLLDRVEAVAGEDSLLLRAAEEHRTSLSASLRFSRLYALVAERFVALLPAIAVFLALLVTAPALLLARTLSRSISAPVRELAGWTERIARNEPLPPPESERGVASVEELEALRGGLRRMETELRSIRRREVEAARLRSWTEMARRVAHELKNPLTPMRMAALALSRRKDPTIAAESEVLLDEIQRLDEMARSFAQFGRMPEGPVSEIDLEELLAGIVARHDREDLRVELAVASGTPRIHGRFDSLGRVFGNLVLNAVEAAETPAPWGAGGTQPTSGGGDAPSARGAPGGGEGHPFDTAGDRAGDLRRVLVTAAPEGEGVTVRVEDSGPGIQPGDLERIWTPDFTTKRRGSGIGLALVRQTVEAHGGRVRAGEGELGGAVFTVWLPLTPPMAGAGGASDGAAPRGAIRAPESPSAGRDPAGPGR